MAILGRILAIFRFFDLVTLVRDLTFVLERGKLASEIFGNQDCIQKTWRNWESEHQPSGQWRYEYSVSLQGRKARIFCINFFKDVLARHKLGAFQMQ